MSDRPLVTITIPTYHSARTLTACLESVQQQDYGFIQVVVVDSHSRDETLRIAQAFGAETLTVDSKLLGARVAGIQAAQGEYVLMLDSDHVLSPTAVTRAVAMMGDYDALFLEERSLKTKGLVPRLFDADRCLIQARVALHADPMRGVLLRRFFRRDLLVEAVSHIPSEVIENAVTFDHEIINYEFDRLSRKVALLPEALWHHDPKNVLELWRKNFRYGKMARAMARLGYYTELRRAKARPRLGFWHPQTLGWGMMSSLLLTLKAPAILAGYILG